MIEKLLKKIKDEKFEFVDIKNDRFGALLASHHDTAENFGEKSFIDGIGVDGFVNEVSYSESRDMIALRTHHFGLSTHSCGADNFCAGGCQRGNPWSLDADPRNVSALCLKASAKKNCWIGSNNGS
jgi:hypothetical protein